MEKAKIQLSEDELRLMQNGAWILTKNGVIEKMVRGLAELAENMQEEARKRLPDHSLVLSNPKISRGEKYEGLPYLMLDYPRNFGKDEILAIRTFFWWGNFCSVTLHVKGKSREMVANLVTSSLPILQERGFYLSVTGDEWDHDIRSDGYERLAGFSAEQLTQELSGEGFLKLTAKVELGQWEDMEKELFASFLCLVDLMRA